MPAIEQIATISMHLKTSSFGELTMSLKSISAFCLSATLCFAAQAQSTVQEVLDAGGKRLTTEDLQKIMPSTQFTGKMNQGYDTDLKLDKDGSFKGQVFPPEGTTPVYGWWQMKDDTYCMDMRYQRGTTKFCNSVYELKGRYFVAGSKPQADSKVQERFFKSL
jgi:hypothetical protein